MLKIENKTISTPIIEILKEIKNSLRNGKLASLKVKNDNIVVNCPVHKNGLENTPSCNVYIGKDTKDLHTGDFHCFTCGSKGPFYHFVAECFDADDEWAKEWLLENYADGIIEYEMDLPEIDLNPVNHRTEGISESVIKDFQDFHPYMLERKLTKEVCKQFEVKYDPKGKCLVFPVRDEKGKLVMLTRRSVENKRFVIDADKEKPVYLLYYLLKNNIQEAYICESQINCLTMWTHGFPAVALFGTGSQHQYDILNKSNIRVYNLLFDGDDAGDKGIKKFLKNIRKDVIVNVIKVPRGKDVNDLSYEEVEKLIQEQLYS